MFKTFLWAAAAIWLTAAPAAARDLFVQSSAKYDALCLIGVLTGDPFYVKYYPDDYERFAALMTPKERIAFARLKTIIKDEGGGLVGPKLSLMLSVLDEETIHGLIAAVEEPKAWKTALMRRGLALGEGLAVGWGAADWQQWDAVRPSLAVALRFLDRVGFEEIWRREWKPAIETRIAEIEAQLGNAQFLDLQEKLLGFRPVTGAMTAYLVHFSKPHGIRITGARYITAFDYPLHIILQNAVHEPMHAPFDPNDPKLWAALAPLRDDAAFMDRVVNHNPDFGYNSFEGLVEEDCVEALDQIVVEQMSVARPADERWRKADDGLHILAAALYALMKTDGYDKSGGVFAEWLASPATVRRLAGHVKELAESVMGKGTVAPLPARAAQ